VLGDAVVTKELPTGTNCANRCNPKHLETAAAVSLCITYQTCAKRGTEHNTNTPFHGGNTGSNPVGDAKVAFSTENIWNTLKKLFVTAVPNPSAV
jgi:hypothetical protein